jgi:hypothetical protein
MADENLGYHWAEMNASLGASLVKGMDTLRHRDSDQSHARVFRLAAFGGLTEAALLVKNLDSLYRLMFNIGDCIYGTEQSHYSSRQQEFLLQSP